MDNGIALLDVYRIPLLAERPICVLVNSLRVVVLVLDVSNAILQCVFLVRPWKHEVEV